MQSHFPVVIVGGGQAGLSVSYCLQQRGIDNIIFEKYKIAHSWQTKRWDSFCLVTPNWQCTLPGYPYTGDNKTGFMQRDDIVRYIEDYASSFSPCIKEGVSVLSIRQHSTRNVFEVVTSIGTYTADQVVVATGGYHTPKIPRMAERLPERIVQLHSSEYQNPRSLPPGDIMVVGTGQSGCQIAEDLHLAGRKVHLSVGGAPRSPREYRGKDVVDWLDQMGYYDIPIDEHPQKETVRTKTNHYVTGRGGGREIDLRQFATEGMHLHGRLNTIQSDQFTFKPDLKENLDYADSVAESIKGTIDQYIEKAQIDAPTEPTYKPIWEPDQAADLSLKTSELSTVIWSTGYHTDFSWIELSAFNGKGYPGHERGVSATTEGLYFIGLPWLYTWGSARFSGIARDATYLADCIALKSKILPRRSIDSVNTMALGS